MTILHDLKISRASFVFGAFAYEGRDARFPAQARKFQNFPRLAGRISDHVNITDHLRAWQFGDIAQGFFVLQCPFPGQPLRQGHGVQTAGGQVLALSHGGSQQGGIHPGIGHETCADALKPGRDLAESIANDEDEAGAGQGGREQIGPAQGGDGFYDDMGPWAVWLIKSAGKPKHGVVPSRQDFSREFQKDDRTGACRVGQAIILVLFKHGEAAGGFKAPFIRQMLHESVCYFKILLGNVGWAIRWQRFRTGGEIGLVAVEDLRMAVEDFSEPRRSRSGRAEDDCQVGIRHLMVCRDWGLAGLSTHGVWRVNIIIVY